jgi:hypothetical protein
VRAAYNRVHRMPSGKKIAKTENNICFIIERSPFSLGSICPAGIGRFY